MPKTELVQKFHVLYLGMTSVSRPIGKLFCSEIYLTFDLSSFTQLLLSSGMDIINGAIESLVTSTGKEEWTPVKLSIADTTVAVMKDKARDENQSQLPYLDLTFQWQPAIDATSFCATRELSSQM